MILQLRFNERGFSIFGIVLVLVAVSVAGTVVFSVMKPAQQVSFSSITADKALILQQAVQKYKLHHSGSAPAQIDHLVSAVAPPCAINTNTTSPTYRKLTGWCGPYIDQPIQQNPQDFKTDGWGTPFQYSTSTLLSCGANKTCGDSDDIVTNL